MTHDHDTTATVPRLALSPREAAIAIGIGEKTLWNETQPRGSIPCFKIGTRVLYPVHMLRDWMAEQANAEEKTQESDLIEAEKCR